MKTILIILGGLLISLRISAGNQITINEQTCVHLICPAAVSYVQVGQHDQLMAETISDYPNIVRIKAVHEFDGTSSLTIVCQGELFAFEVSYDKPSALQLQLYNYSGESIKEFESVSMPLHKVQACIYRLQAMESKGINCKTEIDGIKLQLDELRVKHDLLFIRLKVHNTTNTNYRAGAPVFVMQDKRPRKAANVQEYLLEPCRVSIDELFITPGEEKQVIMVFKTFSIPRHKEVMILLREQTAGYTGRDLNLSFSNKAIAKAGTL
ncbi:DUF4138 domain-containing protein [Carboxylicivirga marina]|uniref:DUF4138 domain-containing protein n=1 Tax=Carboxylicivirga marina TaxID=2800988 RepID=A0ABS1HLX6_9BACT|nr:DUF4138 domain-containing protein [Carboxylicivirga marina]MBK3518263.1 DUF4138 domain-containing protein [Carboxylicivirga marina]